MLFDWKLEFGTLLRIKKQNLLHGIQMASAPYLHNPDTLVIMNTTVNTQYKFLEHVFHDLTTLHSNQRTLTINYKTLLLLPDRNTSVSSGNLLIATSRLGN